MARKKDDGFLPSLELNKLTYVSYFNRLKALTISRFEWVNLPPSIDERFLELTLFEDGKAIFFKDDVLGYLSLQCMASGEMNVYRVPTTRRAYATTGYQKELNEDNSVIIYNDVLRNNSLLDCEFYSLKMYEIERTLDINMKAQKTPVLILCDENQRLVMENLYMKYEGNQPFIFGDKNLDIKNIQALKTDAPFVSDKLQQLKNNFWNEALTNMGITNVNTEKKERLLNVEVQEGNSNVIAQRNIWLNARKQACKQINEMFNLNIDVKFRVNEVSESGEVYNTSEDNL